jgi:hypothetical protein
VTSVDDTSSRWPSNIIRVEHNRRVISAPETTEEIALLKLRMKSAPVTKRW